MKTYFVYTMANGSRRFYTGVTSNLEKRVLQHRDKASGGYTAKYNMTRLVYFEQFGGIRAAITRQNQIKSWGRTRKLALIESINPDWKDLSADWSGTQSRPGW